MSIESKNLDYQTQHKLRLGYMPWLYYSLKAKHKEWASPWQQTLQRNLSSLETVHFGEDCFIAPQAKLFAEPGRDIVVGDKTSIAADTVLHGPIELGSNVSINHHANMDGGRSKIIIGDDCRIAAYCNLYAFNHRLSLDRPIHQQGVESKGIRLGKDVWIGANVGIVDGVELGDHVVVGMNAQVTKSFPAFSIIAGNPARMIASRQDMDEQALAQLIQEIGV